MLAQEVQHRKSTIEWGKNPTSWTFPLSPGVTVSHLKVPWLWEYLSVFSPYLKPYHAQPILCWPGLSRFVQTHMSCEKIPVCPDCSLLCSDRIRPSTSKYSPCSPAHWCLVCFYVCAVFPIYKKIILRKLTVASHFVLKSQSPYDWLLHHTRRCCGQWGWLGTSVWQYTPTKAELWVSCKTGLISTITEATVPVLP